MVHKEKPLSRVIASLEGGGVVEIVCTGNERDEALTNIARSGAAYTMHNLLLEHNATGESIEQPCLRGPQ